MHCVSVNNMFVNSMIDELVVDRKYFYKHDERIIYDAGSSYKYHTEIRHKIAEVYRSDKLVSFAEQSEIKRDSSAKVLHSNLEELSLERATIIDSVHRNLMKLTHNYLKKSNLDSSKQVIFQDLKNILEVSNNSSKLERIIAFKK